MPSSPFIILSSRKAIKIAADRSNVSGRKITNCAWHCRGIGLASILIALVKEDSILWTISGLRENKEGEKRSGKMGRARCTFLQVVTITASRVLRGKRKKTDFRRCENIKYKRLLLRMNDRAERGDCLRRMGDYNFRFLASPRYYWSDRIPFEWEERVILGQVEVWPKDVVGVSRFAQDFELG